MGPEETRQQDWRAFVVYCSYDAVLGAISNVCSLYYARKWFIEGGICPLRSEQTAVAHA